MSALQRLLRVMSLVLYWLVYMSMRRGFALPTVLIAGTALLIMLAAALVAVSSVSASINQEYYQKVASEAAEAGLTYARDCYSQVTSSPTPPTASQWPNSGALSQATDCYGAPISGQSCTSAPGTSLCGVINTSTLRTTFSVGPPTPKSGTTFYTLTAAGTAQKIRKNGKVSSQSYQQSLNQTMGININGIASGNDTTCTIQTGQLYCWGKNDYGQVGNGTSGAAVTTPYHVQNFPAVGGMTYNFVQYVATGISHTCAVVGISQQPSDGNQVYCWGDNSLGQFGSGSTNSGSTTPVAGGSGMATNRYVGCTTVTPDCTAISARDHTCVITEYTSTPGSTANVGEYCWGKNTWGQAGLNSDLSMTNPKLSAGKFFQITDNSYLRPTNIANVSGDGGCAVMTGAVYCWGANVHGELGNGTDGGGTNPKAVATLVVTSSVTKVTTNNARACAIKSGALYCWGANGPANGSPDYRLDSGLAVSGTWHVDTPVQLVTNTKYGGAVTDFAITDWDTCVIVAGKVYCSGYNDLGQLGQGNTNSFNSTTHADTGPVVPYGTATSANQVRSAGYMEQVKGALDGQTVTEITSGNNHFCAITATLDAYCWGDNSLGQLGNGTTDPGLSPTKVAVPATVIY